MNTIRLSAALLFAVCGLSSCHNSNFAQGRGMQNYAERDPAYNHANPGTLNANHRSSSSSRGYSTASNTIQAGDKLDLMIMEDLSYNGQYVVRENGDIIVPKIGRVHVAGSTLDGAQSAVRNRVQSEQLKSATVILDRVGRRPQETFDDKPKMLIYLTGAIRRPGQHFVAMDQRAGLTAYEALLIGGGPSPYADQRRAFILRRVAQGERDRIPVDFRYVGHGYGIDPQIQEGDIIHIPERRFGL